MSSSSCNKGNRRRLCTGYIWHHFDECVLASPQDMLIGRTKRNPIKSFIAYLYLTVINPAFCLANFPGNVNTRGQRILRILAPYKTQISILYRQNNRFKRKEPYTIRELNCRRTHPSVFQHQRGKMFSFFLAVVITLFASPESTKARTEGKSASLTVHVQRHWIIRGIQYSPSVYSFFRRFSLSKASDKQLGLTCSSFMCLLSALVTGNLSL